MIIKSNILFVKVMCGSYAYNRITNRRFNGRLRMKENIEYLEETKRTKTQKLNSNNTMCSVHRMCSERTFI